MTAADLADRAMERARARDDAGMRACLRQLEDLVHAMRLQAEAEMEVRRAGAQYERSPIRFADWLRKERRRRGLTVKELAALAGLSVPYVYQVEGGSNPVGPRTRRRFEQLLLTLPEAVA